MHNASRRVVAIDVLRAIAVLMVVGAHLPFSWAAVDAETKSAALPAWSEPYTNLGIYGVHLFLVLSGFCIHRSWAVNSGTSPTFLGFWRRRLRRLYPPYVIALAISILGYYVVTHAWTPLLDVLALLLLVNNVTGSHTRTGNGVFWSLALEEQLYMLYFPLLAIRRRWGWRWTLAAVLVCVAAWRAIGVAFRLPGWWTLVGPARWLEWTLGAIAVEIHVGLIKVPPWMKELGTALALLMVATVATVYQTQYAILVPFLDILWGLAFFVLVNAFCRIARRGGLRSGRWVQSFASVGLVSYSVYLLHEPAIVMAKVIALRFGVESVPLILAVRLGAGLSIGYAFHWAVERHFLNSSRVESGEAGGLQPVARVLVRHAAARNAK